MKRIVIAALLTFIYPLQGLALRADKLAEQTDNIAPVAKAQSAEPDREEFRKIVGKISWPAVRESEMPTPTAS